MPRTATPAERSTIMSYFRFWPIFSMAGFSRTGRRASRTRSGASCGSPAGAARGRSRPTRDARRTNSRRSRPSAGWWTWFRCRPRSASAATTHAPTGPIHRAWRPCDSRRHSVRSSVVRSPWSVAGCWMPGSGSWPPSGTDSPSVGSCPLVVWPAAEKSGPVTPCRGLPASPSDASTLGKPFSAARPDSRRTRSASRRKPNSWHSCSTVA